jgi:hypothetical protein
VRDFYEKAYQDCRFIYNRPTAVFFRHAHHQILDLRGFSRAAASPFATAIILLRDQPAMPGQQSLGRDNRSHLSEKSKTLQNCPEAEESRYLSAEGECGIARQYLALRAQAECAPLVEGILSAWNQSDLVCLGEDHGSKQDSDLRIALVKNPQFARIVKLIVVEFANPVHQDVLDRFVLDVAEVPHDELASVWRDASSPGIVWESPVYEAFLRAVREVNQRLPRSQRIRVIGGDSPIDWKKITTPQQLAPLLNRNGNIPTSLPSRCLKSTLSRLPFTVPPIARSQP